MGKKNQGRRCSVQHGTVSRVKKGEGREGEEDEGIKARERCSVQHETVSRVKKGEGRERKMKALKQENDAQMLSTAW